MNELSGWREDVISEIIDEPQGGNDDYMFDLDVVNIIFRVKKNNDSFMSVSNTYYRDIKDNKINRAKEFKKIQNMKEVEKAINMDKNRNNMYSSKEWKNKKND